MKKILLVTIILFLSLSKANAQKELSQKILDSKKEFIKNQKNGSQTVIFSSNKLNYTILASKESLSFWIRPTGTTSKDVLETWSTDYAGKIYSFSNKTGTYFYGEYYNKKIKKPLDEKKSKELKKHFEELNVEAVRELTSRL